MCVCVSCILNIGALTLTTERSSMHVIAAASQIQRTQAGVDGQLSKCFQSAKSQIYVTNQQISLYSQTLHSFITQIWNGFHTYWGIHWYFHEPSCRFKSPLHSKQKLHQQELWIIFSLTKQQHPVHATLALQLCPHTNIHYYGTNISQHPPVTWVSGVTCLWTGKWNEYREERRGGALPR